MTKPAPAEPTPNHDASPSLEDDVDALDLDDLEVIPMKSVLSNEASGGRSGAPIVWHALHWPLARFLNLV